MPSAWCLTTFLRTSMLPSVIRKTSASSIVHFVAQYPAYAFPCQRFDPSTPHGRAPALAGGNA